MFRIYLKQALEILRQNPFISIISVLGTALAIMMIMTILVTEEIKNVVAPPEVNRARTLSLHRQVKRDTVINSMSSNMIQYDVLRDYLLGMKTPKKISAATDYDYDEEYIVNRLGSADYKTLAVRWVDDIFWEVFEFDFISGRPFTHEEFESGSPVAIISAKAAAELFGSSDILGQIIQVDFQDYRIIGMVENVSPIFTRTKSEVWIPYMAGNYEDMGFEVNLLADSPDDFEAIESEVRELEKRFNTLNAPNTLWLQGPYTTREVVADLGGYSSYEEDLHHRMIARRNKLFLFALLLIIPALNLSGFSLAHMKKRSAEIGIRKAFGAKKRTILTQVLYENMITTIIGGIIGLLLSFIMVSWLREWLVGYEGITSLPGKAYFAWRVFAGIFAACVILNLISAGIPAFRASRLKIVDSINNKER